MKPLTRFVGLFVIVVVVAETGTLEPPLTDTCYYREFSWSHSTYFPFKLTQVIRILCNTDTFSGPNSVSNTGFDCTTNLELYQNRCIKTFKLVGILASFPQSSP